MEEHIMKKKMVISIVSIAVLAGGFFGGNYLYNKQLFTGEKVGEVTNEKGDTTIATVVYEKNKPVGVNIDVKMADETIKSEASISGAYDMKNEPGLKWHEQVDLLEKAIVDNDFDLSKITLIDEKGNTDAVSGVTIKVGGYLEAVKEAMNK